MKKIAPKSKKIQMALKGDKRFKEISREEALNYLTAEIRKRERCEVLLKQAALELHVKDFELESHRMYLVALVNTAMQAHEVDRLFLDHEEMKDLSATRTIAVEFADENKNSVYLTLKEMPDAQVDNPAESDDVTT